ncbi:hypothetical protein PILCRDRAFT_814354 [Piloderma croceum F 1598]|uniref:Uncharacterized protein n=1 Tax=Piloderma croceum (strain F 1598) TaxID=765440 RepID=A0A0C3GCT7_PILCF|nr:hypothetical protein PILCRDRAFT_814354 [Piloderma croceum F 1598]
MALCSVNTFEGTHLIDMPVARDDWVSWSCPSSSVGAGDVVETGWDDSEGSWFCVGGQTGGRVNG